MKFNEFVTKRDKGLGSAHADTELGVNQSDPDNPNNVGYSQSLINALQDIIDIAQRAMDERSKGLGDLDKNSKDGENKDDGTSNLVTRPMADKASALFGGDD